MRATMSTTKRTVVIIVVFAAEGYELDTLRVHTSQAAGYFAFLALYSTPDDRNIVLLHPPFPKRLR